MKAPTGKLAFAYRTIATPEAERDQLRAEVDALRKERDALRAEVERLRKDAARYQFLRDQQSLPPDRARYAVMRWSERAGDWLHIDFKLDPEIDAYLEASK